MRNHFRRLGLVSALALLGLAWLDSAHAQIAESPEPTEHPRIYRTTGSRVALGRSIRIANDEEVTDAVVVIGGSLRVDGRVRDGVVVVGGNLELGPQADVRGDVVLVGGQLFRDAGATRRGSVSDLTFGDWDWWSWRWFSLPIVDFGGFGRWISLFGALFRISLLAVLMIFVLILARAPVARIGRAAAAEPGRAFLFGLAAEILFLPALVIGSVGLIVTIIGIPLVAILVPVAFLAIFAALIMGFTGLACHIGEWVEDRVGWRGHSAFVATAIGLLLIVAPTMLARLVSVGPDLLRFGAWAFVLTGAIVEFLVWTVGLGAALMTGFGRWSTAPPPLPPVPQTGIVPVTS